MCRLQLVRRFRSPARLRHAGFTLVELLVVIGIIAVLIAMLLPVLHKAREQGSRAVCASNMRQIALAALAYAQDDKRGTLPIPYYGLGTQFPHKPYEAISMEAVGQMSFTLGTLWPYMSGGPETHRRVFNCPWDPDPRVLPNTSPPAYQNFSYCFNRYLDAHPDVTSDGVRLSRVRHPERKIFVAEPTHCGGPTTDFTYILGTPSGGVLIPVLSSRHSGFANEAFGDGHVELIDPNLFNGTNDSTGMGIVNDAYEEYVDLFSPR